MVDFVTPQLIVYTGIILTIFLALQIGAAVMVYAERKVAAFMQQRWGPFLPAEAWGSPWRRTRELVL